MQASFILDIGRHKKKPMNRGNSSNEQKPQTYAYQYEAKVLLYIPSSSRDPPKFELDQQSQILLLG